MRDTGMLHIREFHLEWYEAVSGWKEYSLGSIDEAQEELISVPGSCSACCLQLLLRLCEHLDQASLLSKEVGVSLCVNV